MQNSYRIFRRNETGCIAYTYMCDVVWLTKAYKRFTREGVDQYNKVSRELLKKQFYNVLKRKTVK